MSDIEYDGLWLIYFFMVVSASKVLASIDLPINPARTLFDKALFMTRIFPIEQQLTHFDGSLRLHFRLPHINITNIKCWSILFTIPIWYPLCLMQNRNNEIVRKIVIREIQSILWNSMRVWLHFSSQNLSFPQTVLRSFRLIYYI